MQTVKLVLVTDGAGIIVYREVPAPAAYMKSFYALIDGKYYETVVQGRSFGDVEKAITEAVQQAQQLNK